MELTRYLYDGWNPRIIPAGSRRDWMDRTTESYAYRCLPLKMANAHGWEILSPCGFCAEWNGGPAPGDVTIECDPGTDPEEAPVALFGAGTLTFHVAGLLRTPPGWNIFVGGSPNEAKDAIAPLSGVIETDWSPYSFTMNWRFTRPGQRIRFEQNEPFCFFFPVERGAIEAVEPKFLPIDSAPELKRQFEAWSASRDAFHERMRTDPPAEPSGRWQKLYYRGVDPDGGKIVDDHRTKSQPSRFAGGPAVCPRHQASALVEQAAPPAPPPPPPPAAPSDAELRLAKRDWLLLAQEKLRAMAPEAQLIEQRERPSTETFLNEFYSQNRPLVLTGCMDEWPALQRWTPEYLKRAVGSREVEYQAQRSGNADYEREKERHSVQGPFDAFIDRIAGAAGNDCYLTAYNSRLNAQALASLAADTGRLETYLDPAIGAPGGMMWIGPEGTFTPAHHDLTNNMLAQVVGRKRVGLVAPSGTPGMANLRHVFSDIPDLTEIDLARFPQAAAISVIEVDLMPGEILFIPIGWWHQVLSLDFSVSLTFTNFIWDNDFHDTYPSG